jgi:NAD(P)H-nitrite reductase large subunit
MELPGKLKIGVAGCPLQCAETCIKDIGLFGRKSGWTVLVGGNGGANPRLSVPIAEDLSDDAAEMLVETLVGFYKDNAKPRERIGKMIDRIGLDALKAAVL